MNGTDPTIELSGLDGGNLLAFMAALGVASSIDGSRLSWRQGPGTWIPVLHHPLAKDADALVENLHERLHRQVDPGRVKRRKDIEGEVAKLKKKAKEAGKESKAPLARLKGEARTEAKKQFDSESKEQEAELAAKMAEVRFATRNAAPFPEFSLGQDLTVTPAVFRSYAQEAVDQSSATDRRWVDFVAACGIDCFEDDNGNIKDTELRTMSGAGHQHFLGSISDLVECTTVEHLRTALFEPWVYAEEPPRMRWDPADDRQYALRDRNPSTDKSKTVRGANRLAVEGFRLFRTMPVGRTLRTTGCSTLDRKVVVTWPIWEPPINVETIQSLLVLADLQQREPDVAMLRRRGIAQVFRSRRILVERNRSFTPAVALI